MKKDHTSFLGGSGEGSFHGSAVGIIPPTHSTLILHLVRTNLSVTAHFLKEREIAGLQITF